MALSPERIKELDAITGLSGGGGAPAAAPAGRGSLTPERIAELDAMTGLGEPQGMYAKREANAQKIADDVVNDKISPVSGVLQGVGQAAGLVGDVGGKALEIAAQGAAAMYPREAAVAKALIKPITESETLKAGAQKVGQVYGDVKKAHPEAVGNAEAVGNIAMVLPVGKAVEMAAPLLKPAADVVNKVGGKVGDVIKDPLSAMDSALTPKPKMALPERPDAGSWYKKLRDMKVSFTPDESQKIAFNLDKLVPKDAGEAAVFNKSGIQNNIDMIKGAMKEEPLSFSGAQALRADLNSELKMAYNAGDGTRALHLEKVKEELSGALLNPKGNAKGLEASNAWQMANHEFQIESILGDLDLIAAKASGKAQPANSLDTAINNYLNNKKLSAGLRADERAALEAVTEKTQTGELLKSAASRLAPQIGAAVGGAPGFLVGHYGSMLSRTSAEALKLKKLQAAYDLINARKPPTSVGPWGGGTLYDKGRAKFEASKGKK